jgi:hypothetical protein
MTPNRTGWRRYVWGEKPLLTPQTVGVIVIGVLIALIILGRGGWLG